MTTWYHHTMFKLWFYAVRNEYWVYCIKSLYRENINLTVYIISIKNTKQQHQQQQEEETFDDNYV